MWPGEIVERSYFTPRGEYRVDDQATVPMRNSLMYKMSYHNYGLMFGAGDSQDRVRGQAGPTENPVLNTLDEAYTTENWIVRIYKVKKPDNFGRDHASAAAFDAGKKKRRKQAKSKGQRVLRL